MENGPYLSWKHAQIATAILLGAVCLSCQEKATWESHWEKANVYFQQRYFDKTEEELNAALKLMETGHQEDAKVTQTIIGLGMLYDAQRRFDEAEQYFKRALRLIERTRGATHPDLVMPLNYVGALQGIQHHFDMARPYFERSLSIQEKSLGSTQSLTGEQLKYLAALHASRALYQNAEAFLSRVLELPKPSPETTDKKTVEYLDNYTRLYTAQEEYTKAKPYLDEFDPIDGGQLPKDLHDSSASLARLTNILTTQEKFEKVEDFFRRAVQEAEQGQGSTSVVMAQALSDLADLYWAWGKSDAAIPLLKRSLAITGSARNKEGGKHLAPVNTVLPSQVAKRPAEAAAQLSTLTALRRANQTALQNTTVK